MHITGIVHLFEFCAGRVLHADNKRTLATSEASLQAQVAMVNKFVTSSSLHLNLTVQDCHHKDQRVAFLTHGTVCQLEKLGKVALLYSLDTTPPSIYAPFDYKPRPYYLHKFAAEVYLLQIYALLNHTKELCDSDK